MKKYIINPITGDKILSTEFIVNDYYKIKEENKQLKENYECILKQRDDLTKNATQQIESLIDEKNKYKSLYENEKDHTDTLKRIIKKIEEYIKSQEYFYNDGEESGWDCSIDGYKILDLLKEIK